MLYMRTRIVHTAQRYCCMVSGACLIRRVLDVVYAVWRLASWRSGCIDARTSGDDGHMGCVVVYCCTADFASIVLLIVVSMYGVCEF